jgi:hypothetical protein
MKYLKMFGLAAAAATALMAFVGAGSASATVLCTTKPTSVGTCPTGWTYEGTIHATLKAGTSFITKDTSGFITQSCPASTLHIPVVSRGTGSPTETPNGTFAASELTWSSECTNATNTTAGGTLEIHASDDEGNGTITAKNDAVTISIAGNTCTFGAGTGITLGKYDAETSILTVNTTVNKTAGSFLCPSTVIWKAEYVFTTPAHLYAATTAG